MIATWIASCPAAESWKKTLLCRFRLISRSSVSREVSMSRYISRYSLGSSPRRSRTEVVSGCGILVTSAPVPRAGALSLEAEGRAATGCSRSPSREVGPDKIRRPGDRANPRGAEASPRAPGPRYAPGRSRPSCPRSVPRVRRRELAGEAAADEGGGSPVDEATPLEKGGGRHRRTFRVGAGDDPGREVGPVHLAEGGHRPPNRPASRSRRSRRVRPRGGRRRRGGARRRRGLPPSRAPPARRCPLRRGAAPRLRGAGRAASGARRRALSRRGRGCR